MMGGLVAVALLLPACATVTRGTKETFKINTTPSEAEVSLSSGESCVSPCKLKLKRKAEFTVTAKKAGYKDATAKVESKVKGGGVAGVAGNVLMGGIIGAAVDGSNGSMRDLTPNPLQLTLEVETVPVVAEAPAAPATDAAVAAPVADAAPATGTTTDAPAVEAAPTASPTAGE